MTGRTKEGEPNHLVCLLLLLSLSLSLSLLLLLLLFFADDWLTIRSFFAGLFSNNLADLYESDGDDHWGNRVYSNCHWPVGEDSAWLFHPLGAIWRINLYHLLPVHPDYAHSSRQLTGKHHPMSVKDSRIREIFARGYRNRGKFACGVRNPGLSNPEYSSRSLESH